MNKDIECQLGQQIKQNNKMTEKEELKFIRRNKLWLKFKISEILSHGEFSKKDLIKIIKFIEDRSQGGK